MTESSTAERVGRYQLLEPIGAGPNGVVSRAKVFGVAGFERQFAIKRFLPELTASASAAQALSAAARSYGSLEHPRIARMSEFGVAQGQTFTAVELVAGLDAMRLTAEAKLAGTGLATGGALALVSQAARAVGYAHGRGLSHLGLAPTNIIVTADGDVKVTDFGILSATITARPVDTPRLAARLGYLAPEQLVGETTSAATDVFVLGVIAYELVTGQRAFYGDTPQALVQAILAGPPAEPSLPRPIVRVLSRCLARSQFERFPDARAFADALDAALRVAPVPGTRKDIGSQVKATLERHAAMNEGNLSGMVALNVGAFQAPASMPPAPPATPRAAGPAARAVTPPSARGAAQNPNSLFNTTPGIGSASQAPSSSRGSETATSPVSHSRDSLDGISTTEFVRPDVPVPGPSPLVGPRDLSPASTIPEIPKPPMTVPGYVPPIPVPPGIGSMQPPPPLPPGAMPQTMLGIPAARRPQVPAVIKPRTGPTGAPAISNQSRGDRDATLADDPPTVPYEILPVPAADLVGGPDSDHALGAAGPGAPRRNRGLDVDVPDLELRPPDARNAQRNQLGGRPLTPSRPGRTSSDPLGGRSPTDTSPSIEVINEQEALAQSDPLDGIHDRATRRGGDDDMRAGPTMSDALSDALAGAAADVSDDDHAHDDHAHVDDAHDEPTTSDLSALSEAASTQPAMRHLPPASFKRDLPTDEMSPVLVRELNRASRLNTDELPAVVEQAYEQNALAEFPNEAHVTHDASATASRSPRAADLPGSADGLPSVRIKSPAASGNPPSLGVQDADARDAGAPESPYPLYQRSLSPTPPSLVPPKSTQTVPGIGPASRGSQSGVAARPRRRWPSIAALLVVIGGGVGVFVWQMQLAGEGDDEVATNDHGSGIGSSGTGRSGSGTMIGTTGSGTTSGTSGSATSAMSGSGTAIASGSGTAVASGSGTTTSGSAMSGSGTAIASGSGTSAASGSGTTTSGSATSAMSGSGTAIASGSGTSAASGSAMSGSAMSGSGTAMSGSGTAMSGSGTAIASGSGTSGSGTSGSGTKPTNLGGSADTLLVATTPSGARVFIDGADQGVTPVKLSGSTDRHTMALLLAGHELYVSEVDGHGSFSIPLKAVTPSGGAAGIKVIKCKKDRYYVSVDGKPTGMTCPTERIDCDVGPHTVEVYDIVTETRRSWDIRVNDTRLSYRVRVE